MTTATSVKKSNTALKVVGVLALGALAFAGYNYYQFLQRLRIIPTNLKLGGNAMFPQVVATFLIQNNTDTKVSFGYLNGSLLYGGRLIGYVSAINQEQDLNANGSVEVDVTVNTSAENVIELLADVIKSKQQSPVFFDGVVKIDGVRVPLNVPMNG